MYKCNNVYNIEILITKLKQHKWNFLGTLPLNIERPRNERALIYIFRDRHTLTHECRCNFLFAT